MTGTIDASGAPKWEGRRVADSNEEDANGSEKEDESASSEFFDLAWGALGLVCGGVLFIKTLRVMGVDPSDETPHLSTAQKTLLSLTLLGPTALFFIASKYARKEVYRKSTWAAYWGVMVTLAVAAFTFLGTPNIDAIFKVLKGQ
ncbi:hypothetical protein [Streptomyces ziwulingensis]|uniref:Integral membrane protein n=1 Tax=Streptomyces ziwulingensis TaxID=1045501 RepID=A0ABP9BHX7_9ACTN